MVRVRAHSDRHAGGVAQRSAVSGQRSPPDHRAHLGSSPLPVRCFPPCADEYLFQVCVRNACTLPRSALSMIRFHSFYPWHSGGAYAHLTSSPLDDEALHWVRKFNAHDLYSKAHAKQDVEALRPYYQKLIAKYFPAELRW